MNTLTFTYSNGTGKDAQILHLQHFIKLGIQSYFNQETNLL